MRNHKNQFGIRSTGPAFRRTRSSAPQASLATIGGRIGDLSRTAFTLVEILVVITIIGVLLTLTVGVVGAFLGQAREAATNVTLSKIQSLMNSRRAAFNRLVQRNGFLQNSYEYQIAVNLQKIPAMNMPASAIKPVAIKLLEIKYFPQNANDLNFMMNLYSANPAVQLQYANMYPKLFQPFNNNLAAFIPPAVLTNASGVPVTNSEILYNVLTENVIGDNPLGTDSFSSAEVVTEPSPQPRTTGLPYFVDAWKNSIRYYRWPTRLFRSGGPGAPITAFDVANSKIVFTELPVFSGNLANDLSRDPEDPLQTCFSINNFETFTFAGTQFAAFHTPATYHIPIIVSAGPDGQFGLLSPDDNPAVSFGYLAMVDPNNPLVAQDQLSDNLVSASIKAGGK